jgi:hypothetical protein
MSTKTKSKKTYGKPRPAPNEHQGFSYYDLPEKPNGASRFAIRQTAAGWNVPGGLAGGAAHALATLIEHRIEDAEALEPDPKTVKLHGIVKTADGYVLIPRGSITDVPTRRWTYTGRFGSYTASPALLDELFLGNAKLVAEVRDEVVWESARMLCEQLGAGGEALRGISDSVAQLILLRQGIARDKWSLPPIGRE